jgi:hypothetical protein
MRSQLARRSFGPLKTESLAPSLNCSMAGLSSLGTAVMRDTLMKNVPGQKCDPGTVLTTYPRVAYEP